jgi:hypothetical protein
MSATRPLAEIPADLDLSQTVLAAHLLLSDRNMHAHALVERVRGEFNEMPGLQLTVPQAARLLGIEQETCNVVIETLVASSFLRRTPTGTIVRTGR